MHHFIYNGLLFTFFLFSVYIFFPPKGITFVSKNLSEAPIRSGVIAVNNRLKSAEVLFREIEAPEDIAFDSEGFLYTGDARGVIWKIDVQKRKVEKFANTLGRPLGLKFHGDVLYVTDSLFGLLSVDKNGRVTQLCSETKDGVRVNLANALDVTKDGTVYFVDSSQIAKFHNLHRDILSGTGTGRLIRYDPSKNTCETLSRGLHFANGLALSQSEDALIISEGSLTISKYHLTGPKAGQKENFLNPPGLSDNIKRTSNGNFLIALPIERNEILEKYVHPVPFLKQVLMKIADLLCGLPLDPYAQVILVDSNGKILQSWEDPRGETVSLVSCAVEKDGYIYLGSFKNKFIARLKI